MPYSWLPEPFYPANYLKALEGNDGSWIFPRNVFNSLFVSITVAITTVIIASITGYASRSSTSVGAISSS
jgi:multiple sugar transport system permease protein